MAGNSTDQYFARIENILDSMAGNSTDQYFATIDMKYGYHQVEIDEIYKERTAFRVGPISGFSRMPFGLVNASAT